MDHHQTIYENPSPGNKKGGISTLEDKSCGCTQKAGTAPVCGILQYAEPVKEKGLNLLSAPGNDLVAATATLQVSGTHARCFSPRPPEPRLRRWCRYMKILLNTKIAEDKKNWIALNAGRMVEDMTKEQVAQALFDYVLKVASGEKVKSEAAGFHDIAIFKQGVTL